MPVRICIFSTFMLKSLNGDQSFLTIFFWYACFILSTNQVTDLFETYNGLYMLYYYCFADASSNNLHEGSSLFNGVDLQNLGKDWIPECSDSFRPQLGQRFSGIYTCLNVCFGFFVMFHFHIYRILH